MDLIAFLFATLAVIICMVSTYALKHRNMKREQARKFVIKCNVVAAVFLVLTWVFLIQAWIEKGWL